MHPPGPERLDLAGLELLHRTAGSFDRRPHPLARSVGPFSGADDQVDMDRSAVRSKEREGGRDPGHRGRQVAQDRAIGGSDRQPNLPVVAELGPGPTVDAIQGEVLGQVPERDRVLLDGPDQSGPSGDEGGKREVAHPGEEIHHGLPAPHQPSEAVALRPVPPREERRPRVEPVSDPVLHDRGLRGPSGDRLERGLAELANDGAGTAEHGLYAEGRPIRFTDQRKGGSQPLREPEHDDPPDPLVAIGQLGGGLRTEAFPHRRPNLLGRARTPGPRPRAAITRCSPSPRRPRGSPRGTA